MKTAIAPPKPKRRFANLTEAAEYFDCSDRTIRRLISTGSLTGYRVGPRMLRVDLDELDALAEPIPTAATT